MWDDSNPDTGPKVHNARQHCIPRSAALRSNILDPAWYRIDTSWLPMLGFAALLRGSHEPFRFVQISHVDLER